jgi:hypothetical protein
MASFLVVGLIDADRVNPERRPSMYLLSFVQKLPKGPCHIELLAVQLDRVLGRRFHFPLRMPHVGQSSISCSIDV